LFDTLKHACLGGCLDLRVRDGVIRRLIGKGLHAGVLDRGQISYPEEGTPQGGVISPLLANIYLHYVLDCWYVEEGLGRKLKGHFGYFGITGNSEALRRYRREVIKVWRKWLARRGGPQGMPWERMHRLLAFFYLPAARVIHSIYAAKP